MIGVVDTSAFLRMFIPDGPMPEGFDAFMRGVERKEHLALAPDLSRNPAGGGVSWRPFGSEWMICHLLKRSFASADGAFEFQGHAPFGGETSFEFVSGIAPESRL